MADYLVTSREAYAVLAQYRHESSARRTAKRESCSVVKEHIQVRIRHDYPSNPMHCCVVAEYYDGQVVK